MVDKIHKLDFAQLEKLIEQEWDDVKPLVKDTLCLLDEILSPTLVIDSIPFEIRVKIIKKSWKRIQKIFLE